MKDMIDIRNITKSFGSLQVLKGIDLHIDKGEVVSIVGPSGAGKTTLLQIIGTLDRPDTGSVTVDGIDVTSLSSKKLSDFRNQHLGFVFQFHQLLPEFTAIENIMIPAYIAGMSHKQARQRAKELLEQTPLHVYEIAHRVGFAESKYLVVCFEQETGLSPAAYRRERTGKDDPI